MIQSEHEGAESDNKGMNGNFTFVQKEWTKSIKKYVYVSTIQKEMLRKT